MAKEYLDKTGLAHFWEKIKSLVLQNGIFYGTCTTSGGTVAKVATVSGVTELKTGITIAVKFTNANTATSPTLKVNSLDAKAIKRYGTTAVGTSAAASWQAGAVVTMTYDGTNWVAHDWNNTTYSSMSVAEYEAGTGTTARTITPARLKGAIQHWDAVTSVNSKTGAVTLTASDVSAVPTSRKVNNKALSSDITLTASDVGALPNSTTIPSKLSDLTNDLIYDLGTVTVNDGVFSVSADDVTAITSLWNDGYCGLKMTVNSKDYYAYKERMITYNTLSFMGFVAVEADITSNIVTTGKTLVGINSSGVGMFAVISDLTGDGVPTYETDPLFTASAASGITTSDINEWNGKQDALVSGTNIKTINSTSLLGSGDIAIAGGTVDTAMSSTSTNAVQNKVIKEYVDEHIGAVYITETGTSGIWTYRKWSDGTAECWGTHSWSISSWTGWGSTYYSTYSGNISYPSGLFNATPTVTADGHASTGDAWLAGRSGGSSTQTPSYFLMRSSNGTSNITGYLHIHAIGTWQ